jgi:hypothetical protein
MRHRLVLPAIVLVFAAATAGSAGSLPRSELRLRRASGGVAFSDSG